MKSQIISARCVVLFAVWTASVGWAEDPRAKAAREELERQLSQMVGDAPTKVRLDFVPLDDPNYLLEEAAFELDGRSLDTPSAASLSGERERLLWQGDVAPGKHVVKARLVYANGASAVVSDEGGYKWKVGGDVTFDLFAGIEVRVRVVPRRDPTQVDISKRMTLSLPAKPFMVAKLDDGKMPEPLLVKPAAIDAGTPAVAASIKTTPQEKAVVAAITAETKREKAAVAREERRLAAEARTRERQEQAAAALEAKRAAREARRLEREARQSARKPGLQAAVALPTAAVPEEAHDTSPPPEPEGNVADAGSAEPALALDSAEDAGLEEFDAGAVAVLAVAPPTVSPVVESATETEGPPWLLIGGAGGLAALIFIVMVMRKRSGPRDRD